MHTADLRESKIMSANCDPSTAYLSRLTYQLLGFNMPCLLAHIVVASDDTQIALTTMLRCSNQSEPSLVVIKCP